MKRTAKQIARLHVRGDLGKITTLLLISHVAAKSIKKGWQKDGGMEPGAGEVEGRIPAGGNNILRTWIARLLERKWTKFRAQQKAAEHPRE